MSSDYKFDIGNVYSLTNSYSGTKTYYIAVDSLVLITYRDSKFATYTTQKTKNHTYEGISVTDLCYLWGIPINQLDKQMRNYFAPDEQAKRDARKRRKEIEYQEELLTM